jgi:hypothetical protein
MSLVRFEWLCGVDTVKPIAYYGRVRGIPVVWDEREVFPWEMSWTTDFISGLRCPVWWPGYEDFAEIGCRRVK